LIASFLLDLKLTNLEEAKPENKKGLEVELEIFIKENKDHIDEKLLNQLL
jgi:hypothetical protein